MIYYPKNWKKIGAPITAANIEKRLVEVLREIYCSSLSFSGGVDSSLLLYYMCKIFDCRRIDIFTMGISEDHPDVMFAKSVVEQYKRKFPWADFNHYIYYPQGEEIKDTIYGLFYKFVREHTDSIIAGDVIDEYMCGYYPHMKQPTEKVYYEFIRRLQEDHLIPLNKASGDVKVYLPYADEKIVALLSQIPLEDKVDSETRKKVMIEMAKGKVPDEAIFRRKYGFCDALTIKGVTK